MKGLINVNRREENVSRRVSIQDFVCVFQLGISASDLDKLLAKARGESAGPARLLPASISASAASPLDDFGQVKRSRPPHHDDCCPVCLEGLLSARQPGHQIHSLKILLSRWENKRRIHSWDVRFLSGTILALGHSEVPLFISLHFRCRMLMIGHKFKFWFRAVGLHVKRVRLFSYNHVVRF